MLAYLVSADILSILGHHHLQIPFKYTLNPLEVGDVFAVNNECIIE
jgi:hypothetical protein